MEFLENLPLLPSVWVFSSVIFFTAVYLASPVAAQRKLRLYPVAIAHILLSSETWFRRQVVRQSDLHTVTRRRRILFIRHGESCWNVMFNRGFLTRNFLPNLVSGLLDEVSLLPTADSVFLDSPLSPLGISQALSLQSWVDSCSVEESAFGVQLRS